MQLATVSHQDRERVIARFDDDSAIPLSELLRISGAPNGNHTSETMMDVVRGGEPMLSQIQSGLEAAHQQPGSVETLATAELSWLPPVPRPGKICGVAMNNSASNARKLSAPDHPAFFLKPSSCLVGHGQPIRIRPYYGSVHPEPELAVVIGQTARDVPAERALELVFGYSIFDDITSNGMRAEDRFHYLALYAKADQSGETERVEQHLSYAARYKGTDGFGVLGPWLTTRDAVPNPDALAVHCKMGGETIAEDSTRYYNYKVAELVSFISYFQTLDPGDVISCGTAFKPATNRRSIHSANLQLVAGPIEIEIENLGHQMSPVVVESTEIGPWRLK